MARIEEAIEVAVPIATAYNQWTQFEDFPRFMQAVREVRQTDDTHLHWVAEVAGRTYEWDAEIVEQKPEQLIAWRSTAGVASSGVVTFERGADGTRIALRIDFEPGDAAAAVADAGGLARRAVRDDLERFKRMIEARGLETGGWRGKVEGGVPTSGAGG
jgi:uncharacterized membrane protein